MKRKWILLGIVVFLAAASAQAGTVKILHSFGGPGDATGPSAGVVIDKHGNLYGTVVDCFYSYGLVYQLQPSAAGWQYNVILPFTNGGDGACPRTNVILDRAGHLYGTTTQGGNYVDSSGNTWGVVYQLAPYNGRQWIESEYYNFEGGADGGAPAGGLVMDSQARLYGTTDFGGDPTANAGTVFQLVPEKNGGWSYNVLHTFQGGSQGSVPTDGADPRGNLVLDAAGNLYGTTVHGGGACGSSGSGCGVVFRLSPNPQGGWTYTTLHAFTNGNDGGYPWCHLVRDVQGNLYGTTEGGGRFSYGTVFEMEPAPTKTGWKEVVLHHFNFNPYPTGYKDGYYPWTGVTLDNAGNLYGTTNVGGAYNVGTVFKLTKAAHGAWKETILYSFTGEGNDGAHPQDSGGVAIDAGGNVYGTTYSGGHYGLGTVFEVTP